MRLRFQPPGSIDWELLGLAVTAFVAPVLVVWLKVLEWPLPGGNHRVVWDFPCTLCGGTRALKLLMSGDWPAALAMNPLVTVTISALLLWLPYAALVLMHRWRRLRVVDWSTNSVRWATGLGLLLLIANWVYVWKMGI